MMSMILMMIFLIPLCFFNKFWLIQFLFFIMSFMYLQFFSIESFFYSLNMGCDFMSFILVILSFWICSLMILASEKIYVKSNYSELFLLIILLLMMSLFITFSSLNLFMFYLFFEISLIPTLLLIIGWGYQPERIEAGVYLLFYTLLVSLPMMISMFYIYKMQFSLEFYFLMNSMSIFVYLSMMLVFLIKLPMFFVHLWLPKAHVEAPISGSMILAGVMLKLGGYGLIRVMKMFIQLGCSFNMFFIVISLVGGFMISLICICQSDMKMLIAYSSVAHMGLFLAGVMSMNSFGLFGGVVMMLAHGLCSSGLFCLANIFYERLMSRSLYLNKGLINVLPSMALWMFLFNCCNMAAPPSLNLMGEILIINSLLSWSWISMLFLSLISFFGAVYSLMLYSYSQHGELYSGLYSFSLGLNREYLLLFLHLFPLNMLMLKSNMFMFY
uniref:NADH-ubiquinone oxidoreductase chain 4 n=1 Tax=Uleiota sp. BMNH 833935 TaxID=1903802 RepID=A0A343A461_9CUCU|nr:NADH dehydrogenase subunit 4 [Uleiota sp. BMNH 833935]